MAGLQSLLHRRTAQDYPSRWGVFIRKKHFGSTCRQVQKIRADSVQQKIESRQKGKIVPSISRALEFANHELSFDQQKEGRNSKCDCRNILDALSEVFSRWDKIVQLPGRAICGNSYESLHADSAIAI